MSRGWAFLVGRGRHTVYRTLLAPGFLVDENLHHVLAQSTGTALTARVRSVQVSNPRVGELSIGYRSEQLTAGAVDTEGSGSVEPLTDEHGRPLEIVYGVVSCAELEEPLDAEDLQTARAQAIESYRRFLADEDGHQVESSAPFSLRTRGVERALSTRAVVSTPAGHAIPSPSKRMRRSVPALSRRLQAGAVAAGLALVIGGLSSGFLSGEDETPAVNPAWLDKPPAGTVRYCVWPDPSSQRRSVSAFNRRFRDSRARLVQPSIDTNADFPRLSRSSSECDVISLDVIHVTELASKDLLYDMTSYLQADNRRRAFNAQMMQTVEYKGRLWGVPKQLDVGVLYYRSDVVRTPRSWQDVYRQAKPRHAQDLPGLRFQTGSREGLTVVLLELAYAAGAQPIVSDDGETASLDQPQVRQALQYLRNAVRDRVIPRGEPSDAGSLFVYELGRASFLRSWPYVAARLADDADTTGPTASARKAAVDNTEIVPLPPWTPGGRSVAVLGGRDLVIPRSARNPSAALHLIAYLTGEEEVRRDERDASQIPVLTDVADDPDLTNRQLLDAVRRTQVRLRPALPRYAAVSRIVSSGVKAILDAADEGAFVRYKLKEMERDVQSVLDG